MTNTIYLLVFLLSLTLSSCGGGEHSATDTGSASFGLKFEEASAPAMKLAPSMAPADICTSYGIDSISGTVYNSSNTAIATGGPWACSAHTGTINNIPPGSNLRIAIKGTVSGTVVWQGETTGATIYAGQDTNIGAISMTYTGNDTTRPTVSAATPTGTTVPLTSPITVTFSEPMAASTIDSTTFTLKNGSVAVSGSVSYNATTKTATFTPTSSLSNSVIYTSTVTTDVTDMAANRMLSLYTWDFTTEAPPGSAPTTPTGVSATAADKQVTISWTAVTGATSYNIYWSTTTGVTKTNGTLITGATSPYTHTALTNGTTYYYVVTAVNSYGESAASSQTSAIPLPPITSAPTGISATAGNTQATISWSAVTGATSYNLYWSTTTGVTTSNGTKITGATSPYIHTGLTNGTTYYYIVTAVNLGGESTASSQVSATPQVPVSGAPTGVSATAGNGQVTIGWSAVTGATSYNVYWSTTSGSGTGGTEIAVGNVISYTHTGLVNGTSYYYVVTAVNGGGESTASGQVSATPQATGTAPSAPTGVAVIAGNGQAIITWPSVLGATSYNIYWSTTFGVTKTTGTKSTGATSPYTHTGLTNGTTYYYVATAVNSYGESIESSQVSVIPSAVVVTAISAGGDHTAALKSDGAVWTWGWNYYGQLGDGTTTSSRTPVQVSGLTDVTAIAVGESHTVALKNDGTVWAWGYNLAAQLGDGTTTNRYTPVQVSGLTGVSAIAAGYYSTVALKSDGTVWAWGDNQYGQLGDGTTTTRSTPVQVTGLTGVTAVAAGSLEGYIVALKNDGTVWTWGYNQYYGQLGDGTTTNRSIPVQVSGLTGISAIAGGGNHTIALKNDGTVWAWGRNGSGQLGDGTTTNRYAPVQVNGLAGVTAISAGHWDTIALKSDGTVWAWGDNSWGQLGDGTTTTRYTPAQVSGLNGVTAISARDSQTIVLKNDWTVWAWGYNFYGQLGDGTTTTRYTPVLVSGL